MNLLLVRLLRPTASTPWLKPTTCFQPYKSAAVATVTVSIPDKNPDGSNNNNKHNRTLYFLLLWHLTADIISVLTDVTTEK